jgi:tetratricopeptide (TPR) repeat protein
MNHETEIRMKELDLEAKAREYLVDLAERQGMTRSSLAQALGRNPGYFQSVGKLSLSSILEALPHLGIEPRHFFAGAFVGPRISPTLALRLERERPKGRGDAFLAAIEPKIIEAHAAEVTDDPAPSNRQVIERLEDLRFRDHDQARAELQRLIHRLLDGAQLECGRFSALMVAEAAAALTCWAAVRRMKGQRDLAGDALVLAFGLAMRSGDAWAEGLCYKRGAFLMREYGRPDTALEWLDEAAFCFERSGDEKERKHLLADRGQVLADLGDTEHARRSFEAALRILPGESFRHIASAHEGYARVAAQIEGRREEAREHLRSALACFRCPDYAYAHVLRGQGSFQLAQGEIALATATLREALGHLQKFGSIFDVAMLALDIAPLVASRKDNSELRTFVDQLRDWLPALRRNRAIRELLDDVLARLEMGRLTDDSLAEARSRLFRSSTRPLKD